MIFVCTGSREYQFNRLLREIDRLIEDGKINEKVIAQIGDSSYVPKNYDYERFMDSERFEKYQNEADIIITHGGTGAVIGALKKKKQVIAVPRLAKYGEHIDDHQTQIVGVLADQGLLVEVLKIKELNGAIKKLKQSPITKSYNKESNVFSLVDQFIEQQSDEKKKGLTPLTKSIILAPLNVLYGISPRLTLKILFRLKHGTKLNLSNPKSYSEKLQWIKLYHKNPILPKLVDKYTVREYVEEKCPGILNELIWQGFNPEEIPWDKLPEKCVFKVTHGSALNIICDNSKLINKKKTKKTLDKWLKYRFIKCYGEWFYGVERPRIIIEKFIESEKDLKDYKIFCFNGEPYYIGVYSNRRSSKKPAQEIYDTKWNLLDCFTGTYEHPAELTPKPKQLKKVLEYAKTLSSGFPHVRVDFYIEGDKIYFGELTFTSGAGFDKISPYEFDLEMGEKMKLLEE